MSEPRRSARQTPVAECVNLLAIEPLLALAGYDLLVVVRRAARRPETRLIGIVDDGGVLVGVVPILRLAESVIAHVAPEALLADIADLEDVARFGDAVDARTIGDVMLAPASIGPTHTVDEAFRLMHRRRLSGLYVVDDAGRPTGYLDLLELAVLYADELDRVADWTS